MQNILLDENYNPKICDFGFGAFNKGKLSEFLGTLNYAAPEILSGTPYDGLKADIFSLGVILLNLITCKIGFGEATKKDPYYRYIMGKHYNQYWKLVSGEIKGISEELKKLYIRMVSYRPNERPTIEEILNDDWIKEIRELSEDQLKELEKEILEEFSKRETTVNEHLKLKALEEDSSCLDFNRGGEGDDENVYFDLSLKPKYGKTGINMRNYIKIGGNLNPAKFMNNLANKVNKTFEDNCKIEESKETLKFNITFEDELEDEVEIPQELEEEFAKLGIEGDADINENLLKKDCVIQCKLYASLNGGHILKFSKKGGELDDYYKNLEKLTSLVKQIV
jgi:serine/threonine protein kinase